MKGSDKQIVWTFKWNLTQTTHYNRNVKNNYMWKCLGQPYKKNPTYQFFEFSSLEFQLLVIGINLIQMLLIPLVFKCIKIVEKKLIT
jgi:hypothetical protein